MGRCDENASLSSSSVMDLRGQLLPSGLTKASGSLSLCTAMNSLAVRLAGPPVPPHETGSSTSYNVASSSFGLGLSRGEMVEDIDRDREQLNLGSVIYSTRVLPRMPSSGTVRSLCVAGNKLDDRALRALCRGLRWSCVRHLDVSHNEITVAGCGALSRLLLSSNCGIASLNAAWNNVRTGGVLALANSGALSDNLSLRQLDLSANAIGGDGDSGYGQVAIKALTEALLPPSGTMLKSIKLVHNYFSEPRKVQLKRTFNGAIDFIVDDENEAGILDWRSMPGATEAESSFLADDVPETATEMPLDMRSLAVATQVRGDDASSCWTALFEEDWNLAISKPLFQKLISRHFRDSCIRYVSKGGGIADPGCPRFSSSSVDSLKNQLRSHYRQLVLLFHAHCSLDGDPYTASAAVCLKLARSASISAKEHVLRKVMRQISMGVHRLEAMKPALAEYVKQLADDSLDIDVWSTPPACIRYEGMPSEALEHALPYSLHRHEFCIELMLVLSQARYKGFLSYGTCSGREANCPSTRTDLRMPLTKAVEMFLSREIAHVFESNQRLLRCIEIGDAHTDFASGAARSSFAYFERNARSSFDALAKDRQCITLRDWLNALVKARLGLGKDCSPPQERLPDCLACLSHPEAICIFLTSMEADEKVRFHARMKMSFSSFLVALVKVGRGLRLPAPHRLARLGMMMDPRGKSLSADYLAAARTFLQFSWSAAPLFIAPNAASAHMAKRYQDVLDECADGSSEDEETDLAIPEKAFLASWCIRSDIVGKSAQISCSWDATFAADTSARLALSPDHDGNVFSNILDSFYVTDMLRNMHGGSLRMLQRSLPSPSLIERAAEELYQRYRVVVRAGATPPSLILSSQPGSSNQNEINLSANASRLLSSLRISAYRSYEEHEKFGGSVRRFRDVASAALFCLLQYNASSV